MAERSATDLSVRQVAGELAVHGETVKRSLRRGELPGYRIGGQWRITRKGLDAFKARQSNPDRGKVGMDVAAGK